MPRRDLLQIRRGTAAQWVTANPILAAAEAGYETDTGFLKYGDGATAWNALDYFAPASTPDPETTLLGNPITALELGRLSGVTSSVQTQLNGKAATSHAHVIADTTGLQAALDAKATTSHTHVISDTTSLQATLDAKLPLAGGTLTGALTLNGAPSTDLHAATKAYVDSLISVGPTHYNAKSNVGGPSTELAGDDTGDDAVKLEALLALVATAGGGRIFFPKGVYRFSRALQDTGASNTQCLIPLVDDSSSQISIDLIGETTPPTQFYSFSGNPTGTGYSILKSTLTGASGTASMIGGKMHAGSTLWNNVMLNFERLVIELPANPTLTAIDLSNQMGNRVERVLIFNGLAQEFHDEPTNSNSYGIKLPPTNHSAYIRVEGLVVIGFYWGMRLGELTEGSARFYGCSRAVESPFAHHPSVMTIGAYGCPRGIVATGGISYLKLDLLSIQHDGGAGQAWQTPVADIDDASNFLHGTATWLTVQAEVGNDHNLIKNGGTNFTTTELV